MEGQRDALEAQGLVINTYTDMQAVLPDLDVVYINAIAWIGDDYETFGSGFKLNKDSPFKPEAIVLHPLARGDELATDLDSTPHNWYFSQARGAVFLRKALLTCLVQRAERVMDVI
jgi:aspartate carbamoyltransferase catalytic subunit